MRIKTGVIRRKRHNKVLKQAKGFRGFRRRSFKGAKEGVLHALKHSYISRKQKKRNMRRLWIQRINAGLKANGAKYSTFIQSLKSSNIELNRKVLSEIAMHDPQTFGKIVEKVSDTK
ncbi:50S ribosomal protein L20 [candidate division WWE3 bacterium]|uniref:Large ribosomal subunit protein bL20 n=1 Tax=candidate division WWE3 bacterium TaxID=2053526 RepID=A0A955RX02_UNCKA|nr:50S ribosomal protein L20 [candidate division WWE3 bacterium]